MTKAGLPLLGMIDLMQSFDRHFISFRFTVGDKKSMVTHDLLSGGVNYVSSVSLIIGGRYYGDDIVSISLYVLLIIGWWYHVHSTDVLNTGNSILPIHPTARMGYSYGQSTKVLDTLHLDLNSACEPALCPKIAGTTAQVKMIPS